MSRSVLSAVSTPPFRSVWRSIINSGNSLNPLPVPSMQLGMNVAWINSWSGAWVFSNLMYHAAEPTRTSGSGLWSYSRGNITTSTPTDTFRMVLADDKKSLPSGEYTILNPDGLSIYVGSWAAPSAGAYTTNTSSTYYHDNTVGDGALAIHIKGSLTSNSGNLSVILPDHLDSWNSGSVWNEQFLNFYRGLKLPILRFMDWTLASQNIEKDWADRSQPDTVTFHNPHAGGISVPYELMCSLAGILGADVWVCAPARATTDYVQQMAAMFASNLSSRHKLWLEYANEIWNYGYPWVVNTLWVNTLNNTNYTALADFANQKFTLQNHGFVNGTALGCYPTAQNRALQLDVGWRLANGAENYVKVVDANSFELYSEVGLINKIPVVSGMVNIVVVLNNEVGKVRNTDYNYGAICLRNWNIFDTAMGEDRVVRLVAAHAANSNTTQERLSVAGVASRASAVAVAPYFAGTWFGGAVDCASGQLTPKFWASDTNPVHMAVYPTGSTPSAADVIAGTGAISKQLLSYTAGANTYTAGVAVSGLTNGVAYTVYFVYVDVDGSWLISVNATPSVGGSLVYTFDSYEAQAIRNRLSIVSSAQTITDHKLKAGDIKVLSYEGGLHFHHTRPAQMSTWIYAYQESANFADVISRYLTEIASVGSTALCYYADSLSTTFSIANGFQDTADLRYQAFKSVKGKAAILTPPTFSSILGENIPVAPTYPHDVLVLGDNSYTYEIASGNESGNYGVVGDKLVMLNGSGVSWSTPTTHTLKIRASNQSFTRTFIVSFATGNAWYEPDAMFAWDSKAAATTSQITPAIGSALALTHGTGAVLENGLWSMGGTNRYSGSALSDSPSATKAILWASVLDKATQAGGYKHIWKHGSAKYMSIYTDSSATTALQAEGYVTAANPVLKFAPSVPTGAHVMWIFFDPVTQRLYAGIDQVSNGYVSVSYGSSTFTKDLQIGGNTVAQSLMKHGSMQIINRAGMTLTDVLSIVAKMQVHHEII